MKRPFQTILGVSAISILACTAPAQNTSNWQATNSYPAGDRMGHSQSHSVKASNLMGMSVKTYPDEKLGKVNDLAIDLQCGRVALVIVASGGFMGMGGTMMAVPPEVLHHDAGDTFLQLDADKEKINAAPKFDGSKWDENTESNRVSDIYAYYGERAYFINDGSELTNADGSIPVTLPRNMDGTLNTTGARTMDTTRNVEMAANMATGTNNGSIQNADGTWTRGYQANGGTNYDSRRGPGYVQKASKLIGAPVTNLQGEKIGKIENLMVDLASGRVTAVIISSGTYMGLAGEYSAVPPIAFRFNDQHDSITLDVSKETLANSPHFSADQWPDLSQSNYNTRVHQSDITGVDSGTNQMTSADNTQRNVRDRNSRTLTPLDQGNSQADVNTTAQIRRQILANNDMSVNAKNVKIITINGQVTLRGPVNTETEKNTIGDIAGRAAAGGSVDNQLEVKLMDGSRN